MTQRVGRPKEIKAREYFAGQALAGIMTQDWYWDTKRVRLTEKELAAKAVRIADYVLESLKGRIL